MPNLPKTKNRAGYDDLARDPQGVAHDVLSRMRSNHEAGGGINLTAAELEALSLTKVGDLWMQDDPRSQDQE